MFFFSLVDYYWVPCNPSNIPCHAVRGGEDSDGTAIYVGRAYHEGDWIPAKVIPEKNISYVAYGGQEHMKHQCEVNLKNKKLFEIA